MTDPVDDTVHFKHIVDNIYKDDSGKIYILTQCVTEEWDPNDTFFTYQYFKDYTRFFDLKTYHSLKQGFFVNKGRVYHWWMNDSWDYPVEVEGADPVRFRPFDSLDGGKDNKNVYYGGGLLDYKIIKRADPRTFTILPALKRSSSGQYFKDKTHVFFEFDIIPGADPATFHIVDTDSIDAADKHKKYFNGKPVHARE